MNLNELFEHSIAWKKMRSARTNENETIRLNAKPSCVSTYKMLKAKKSITSIIIYKYSRNIKHTSRQMALCCISKSTPNLVKIVWIFYYNWDADTSDLMLVFGYVSWFFVHIFVCQIQAVSYLPFASAAGCWLEMLPKKKKTQTNQRNKSQCG